MSECHQWSAKSCASSTMIASKRFPSGSPVATSAICAARSRSQKSASLRSWSVEMPHSFARSSKEPANAGRCRRGTPRAAVEVLREADRVAEQRDPLRLALPLSTREVLGLREGQDRLAGTGSTAHLQPVDEASHLEQGGLLLCEPVATASRSSACAVMSGTGRLRRQDLADEIDVVVVGHPLPRLLTVGEVWMRPARSSRSPRPEIVQRGQSGVVKSSARSVKGTTTMCPHRMGAGQVRQRGSAST